MGLFSLPDLASITAGSATAQSGSSVLNALESSPLSIGQGLSIPGSSASGVTNAVSSNLSALTSPSRLAAGIIGVLAIGAGLLMFKGTQTVIVNGAKGAAALAA